MSEWAVCGRRLHPHIYPLEISAAPDLGQKYETCRQRLTRSYQFWSQRELLCVKAVTMNVVAHKGPIQFMEPRPLVWGLSVGEEAAGGCRRSEEGMVDVDED
jgi:hypothetical protein